MMCGTIGQAQRHRGVVRKSNRQRLLRPIDMLYSALHQAQPAIANPIDLSAVFLSPSTTYA